MIFGRKNASEQAKVQHQVDMDGTLKTAMETMEHLINETRANRDRARRLVTTLQELADSAK